MTALIWANALILAAWPLAAIGVPMVAFHADGLQRRLQRAGGAFLTWWLTDRDEWRHLRAALDGR